MPRTHGLTAHGSGVFVGFVCIVESTLLYAGPGGRWVSVEVRGLAELVALAQIRGIVSRVSKVPGIIKGYRTHIDADTRPIIGKCTIWTSCLAFLSVVEPVVALRVCTPTRA